MVRTLPIWHIKDIAEVIIRRWKNDYDFILLIDGLTGVGKSTVSNKIAHRIPKFKPERDQLYIREDVLKQISTRTNSVIWADELINVAHNRNFYEADQILLVKALNMYRDSHNLFIGCIPDFNACDPQLKTIAHMRITVLRRGVALIQTPNKSLYSRDPWDIKNNQKIESKWSERGISKPRYGKLTTARGYLKFNDVTKKQKELYLKIKHEKRNKILQERFNQEAGFETADQSFYKNLLEEVKTGTLTPVMFAKICKINKKKYANVRAKINEMLRDDGTELRFSGLVKSTNTPVKKDKLGFTIGG